VDPATAMVIGTLEPSPLVWRWVRRAISAGAEVRRPRRGLDATRNASQYATRNASQYATRNATRYAAGGPIDLDGFERIDELGAPAAGDDVLVMLAGRHRGGDVVAGFSGDECVVLLPADWQVPAEQDSERDSEHDSAHAGRAWVALVGLAGRPDRGLSARATFARTGPPGLVPVHDGDARRLEPAR
jgi:hypothetical protein